MSLRASHILQLLVIALLGLAVVMVHSAGMTVDKHVSAWAIFTSRNAMYAGIAILLMLIISQLPAQRILSMRGWASPIRWLTIFAWLLLVLTFVPGIGKTVNGATRWIELPGSGFSFQPSELLKWATVLAISAWCMRRRAVMHRFRDGLLPPLLFLGISCAVVVLEDLGTGVLMAGVGAVLLIAGGARLWQLAIWIPPAVAGMWLAIASSSYRMSRLMAFLNPWDDPQGIGYHPIQSMLAISQGGWAGRGLGNGIQKFGYLPEDTTDFVFAIICEELGIFGAALVIGMYLALMWAGLDILKNCKHLQSRMIVLGVLTMMGLQALINLAVVTVVVPTKGIALPLISAGGTGWIMTAAMLGLVAALDESEEGEGAPLPALAPLPRRGTPITQGASHA